MASPAAQRYFDSFPAAEQARIRESWGGADRMDEWFNAAVQAGAVQPSGERNQGEVAQADPTKSGGWTPQQIREHFQKQGFDTFDLIDDNTINTWINQGLWDPAAKRFKPERQTTDGREIDYSRQPDFKPSDCPEGYTPTGSGPGAKCAPNTDFDPTTGAYTRGAGGGQAATPAGFPAAGPTSVVDPLQAALVAAFQGKAGSFARATPAGAELGEGGIFWTDPTAQRPATGGAEPKTGTTGAFPSAYGGYNPSANQPGSAALTAATLNAFTPAAPSQTGAGAAPAAAPQVTSGSAWSGGALPNTGTPSSVTPAPWVTGQPPSPLTSSVASAYTRRKPQDWWKAQPA